MSGHADLIRRVVIWLSPLMVLVSVGTGARAGEVQIQGQPCNDACQAWLGYGKPKDTTGSISPEQSPEVRAFIRHDGAIASKPIVKVYRPKVEAVRTERPVPDNEVPAPESPKTAVATKHVRSKSQQDLANVPLPVPRPSIASDLPATVADAITPAISRSAELPHKGVEAAAVPDISIRPTAPISLPAPELPATPKIAKLAKEPSDIGPAPTPAEVPSPAMSPPIHTSAPTDNAAKLSVDTATIANAPTTAKSANKPTNQVPTDPAPRAAPPAVVASLPSPIDTGSSLRNDDRLSGTTQENSLQPVPELAGNPLHVSIGQISADPHATDVHVVVVNILQHEIKDLDVRCRARDTQGLQVAEASAHISSIAPSDVAFGQVLFSSEITTRDNQFTCDVGRNAAMDAAAP